MTDRATWERLIDSDPTEATNHLAFADWLAEQGDHEESEFRRAMGEWHQEHGNSPFLEEGWTPGRQWAASHSSLPRGVHFADLNSRYIEGGEEYDEPELHRPDEGIATGRYPWSAVSYYRGYRDMENEFRRAFKSKSQPEQFAKSLSRAVKRT